MMKLYQVKIPWPPKALKPNGNKGSHWAVNATASKRYKSDCASRIKAQGIERVGVDRLHVTVTFNPPCNRRRDLDNMLAAAKSGLDALSDAVGVDDHYWGLTLLRGPAVPNGEINISIAEG